jgi:hypothetical protein
MSRIRSCPAAAKAKKAALDAKLVASGKPPSKTADLESQYLARKSDAAKIATD